MMTKTNSDHFKSGLHVIEETADLLRNLSISTQFGGITEGSSVNITVVFRLDSETGLYRMLLTCFAKGRNNVSWDGLPILLEPENSTNASIYIGRLNTRGQAIINNLPSGSFRLTSSKKWYYSSQPILVSNVKNLDLGNNEISLDLAAAGIEPEEPDLFNTKLSPVYKSNDDRISLTLEQNDKGDIVASFETKEAELANAYVRLLFVKVTGEVVFSTEIKLLQKAARPLWLGVWQGPVSISEPCNVMFEVLPDNSD